MLSLVWERSVGRPLSQYGTLCIPAGASTYWRKYSLSGPTGGIVWIEINEKHMLNQMVDGLVSVIAHQTNRLYLLEAYTATTRRHFSTSAMDNSFLSLSASLLISLSPPVDAGRKEEKNTSSTLCVN